MADTDRAWPRDARYLRCGPLLVDLRYRQVECAGVRTELAQRVFDLLLLFLAEPNVLHARIELFRRLWPGLIVEDANLSQSIWLLRKALGATGKHWVRTVAKGGYVFEPPAPLRWGDTPPEETRDDALDASVETAAAAINDMPNAAAPAAVAADPPADAIEAPPSYAAAAARPRAPRWRTWAVAATLVAALGCGVLLTRDRVDVAPEKVRVALIDVEDSASSARWPARLLHEWLRWKLSSLPEVTFLTEAELAADDGPLAPQVVFLSSNVAPDDPRQVVLRARLQRADGEQRFELRGPAAQAPAMVDTLSRRLMVRLAPNRSGPWPVLELDQGAAIRYAQAAEAFERRDWSRTVAISQDVVALAPRFGLVRLQLALAQARLAQVSSAMVQMDAANALLRPAPRDVVALLDAQRLSVDLAHPRAAADAFAALAARHPERKDYAIVHARLLSRAGEPQSALAGLTGDRWKRAPLGTQIDRLLTLARIRLALGDTDRVREDARAAERLARASGGGWELELGEALLLVARADTLQYQQHADNALYERAATHLDAAGDRTQALYARFLGEAARPADAGTASRLDVLLSKAREDGYRHLEIEILQQAANRARRAGDLAAYRARLEQAWGAAQTSGDTAARSGLDLVLASDDIYRFRFGAFHARLQRLRDTPLQGAQGLLAAGLDTTLDAFRGHYARGVRKLDRLEQELRRSNSVPTAFAALACMRAEYRLSLGDLSNARADWTRCAAPKTPDTTLAAQLGRAYTDLLAGDRSAATQRLAGVQAAIEALPQGPDRWMFSLQWAGVLTRLGQTQASDRIYAALLPALRDSDYRWQAAAAETGIAENAAAQGDWARAQAHAAAAKRGLPADAWAFRSRLGVVDAAIRLAGKDQSDGLAMLGVLDAEAHRLGDVGTQMEIHSLLPDGYADRECDHAQRERLVARTGMRGARADWLGMRAGVNAGAVAVGVPRI